MRVYLTNVEGICRRFVEEKRERLARLREDPASFRAFWCALRPIKLRPLALCPTTVVAQRCPCDVGLAY